MNLLTRKMSMMATLVTISSACVLCIGTKDAQAAVYTDHADQPCTDNNGYGSDTWTTLANCGSDNDTYAQNSVANGNTTTYIQGFMDQTVPVDATITEVLCCVQAYTNNGSSNVKVDSVRITNEAGSFIGNDLTDSFVLPTSDGDTYRCYGSGGWGVSFCAESSGSDCDTAADVNVNHTNFSCLFSFKDYVSPGFGSVDYVDDIYSQVTADGNTPTSTSTPTMTPTLTMTPTRTPTVNCAGQLSAAAGENDYSFGDEEWIPILDTIDESIAAADDDPVQVVLQDGETTDLVVGFDFNHNIGTGTTIVSYTCCFRKKGTNEDNVTDAAVRLVDDQGNYVGDDMKSLDYWTDQFAGYEETCYSMTGVSFCAKPDGVDCDTSAHVNVNDSDTGCAIAAEDESGDFGDTVMVDRIYSIVCVP